MPSARLPIACLTIACLTTACHRAPDAPDGDVLPDAAAPLVPGVPDPDDAGAPQVPIPPPVPVILNEIHYAPADKTVREEFVEIFDAGTKPVDLSGWMLTGGIELTFPAGTRIEPGQYLVIAQDPAVLAARFGGVKALGPFTGRLGNDGESIVLRDATGRRRDALEYRRGFPWPTAGGDGGYSIERVHPSLDGATGASWRLAAPAAGGTTLVAAGQSWRYFKGTREASAPVDAWRAIAFDDSAWAQGKAPIGYGETFIATNLTDMQNGYASVFLRASFDVTDPGKLGRLALAVQVDDGFNAWINGVHVARHNLAAVEMAYNGTAQAALEDTTFLPFDLAALGDAKKLLKTGRNVLAIQLHNASIGGSSDAYLDARLVAGPPGAGPTPGARNAVWDDKPGPSIHAVEHLPPSPRSGEPVTVTARVTDADGVAAVTLSYQLVEPGAYVRWTDPSYATGWITTAMRDDGMAGDITAGDGVFTAVIDRAVQKHRRLVRYRISARDTPGISTCSTCPSRIGRA